MVVLALVTGACTGTHRHAAGPISPTSTSLMTTAITPSAVWGTADVPSGGSIAVSPVDGRVTVGYCSKTSAGPAVVSFGPLSVSSACIVRAVLHVTLSAPPLTRPVAAYPVDPRYGALGPGEWIEGWALLLDNRPRGDFAFTGAEGEADVTDLVKTFVKGGPFPSQGKSVPAGSPLVLSVQPRDLTSPATLDLRTDVPPSLSVSRSC
jgi:hypothetical protein